MLAKPSPRLACATMLSFAALGAHVHVHARTLNAGIQGEPSTRDPQWQAMRRICAAAIDGPK